MNVRFNSGREADPNIGSGMTQRLALRNSNRNCFV
jgi:hypothetical protein